MGCGLPILQIKSMYSMIIYYILIDVAGQVHTKRSPVFCGGIKDYASRSSDALFFPDDTRIGTGKPLWMWTGSSRSSDANTFSACHQPQPPDDTSTSNTPAHSSTHC